MRTKVKLINKIKTLFFTFLTIIKFGIEQQTNLHHNHVQSTLHLHEVQPSCCHKAALHVPAHLMRTLFALHGVYFVCCIEVFAVNACLSVTAFLEELDSNTV